MVKTISEITLLWSRILDSLEKRINNKQIFESFFGSSYIDSIENNTLIVVVNSGIAQKVISSQYADLVDNVVRDITETNYGVRFVLQSEIKDKKIVVEKPAFFANCYLNPKYTFDNFVVGSCNMEANQAALMIAASPAKMFNPLFIYANSGLGKTHLLHAIGNYVRENNPNLHVLCISTEDFISEFVKFVRGDKESDTLKDYFKTIDLLLVDDIQFLVGKPKTEEMFFFVFNQLINSGKQIVITSDRHPNDIEGLEARIITRFTSGLTINIGSPDQATCVAILRQKITANGLDVANFDDDVLEFFAEKFSNNIRELEGALNRLLFYVINIKQTKHISMPIAVESVQPLVAAADAKTKLTEQRIVNVVSDYYNLTPNQLTGKIRAGQVVMARHIAMYLIRLLLDTPFIKIGQVFGNAHHTTVMSGVQKVEKTLKTDTGLSTAINDLKKRLKP